MRWLGELTSCAVLLTLGAVCGCGSDHGGPQPTQRPAPVVTCPPNQAVSTLGTAPVTVNYPAPTVTDGEPPVTATCDPVSGGQFQPGTTRVTCTARDSLARTSTCGFNVDVTRTPYLRVTRFLAFGDSLTEGTTSPDPMTLLVNVPDSYPSKLQIQLARRYTQQSFDVLNEGCGGEFVADQSLHCPGALKRLPDLLRQHSPQVLLLMHGANDLLNFEDAAIPKIVAAMDDMVELAQQAGVRVIVAGLPPQNGTGSRGQGADEVPLLDAELAKMAQRRQATYLDLFGAFGGSPAGIIGVDGLHPTVRGYERIAEVFLETISRTYETEPPTTGSTAPALLQRPLRVLAPPR